MFHPFLIEEFIIRLIGTTIVNLAVGLLIERIY